MNITDKDGKWRLEQGLITNMKTGEVRVLKNTPDPKHVASMPYADYMRRTENAFRTGTWV